MSEFILVLAVLWPDGSFATATDPVTGGFRTFTTKEECVEQLADMGPRITAWARAKDLGKFKSYGTCVGFQEST